MATSIIPSVLYNLKETSFFPSLQPRQPIPDGLKSRHAQPGRPSVVGMGIVKGIVGVLTRTAAVAWSGVGGWAATIDSDSTPGLRYQLGTDGPDPWSLPRAGTSYLAAAAGLYAALDPTGPDDEVDTRWQQLLLALRLALSHGAPYTGDELIRASGRVQVQEAMMALSDAVYFYVKRVNPLIRDEAWPLPPINIDPRLWRPHSTPAAAVATTPLAVLGRLIRRGGTALLYGPTGSGKTTGAKQACLAAGARLVVVKGRPGLDDRQLYGGVYPTNDHFQWVDGPLAQAWRLAAHEPVVLLIDELARLDPYHLAALIGALDRLSGNELRAVLDHAELAAITSIDDAADYYLLNLPNGDRLVTACRNLTIVATTNLGADYVQVQQSFDAALLRRFAVQLHVERLEAPLRQQALSACGVPPDLAERITALEDYTTLQTGAHGGLLQRELNLGTALAWADEACALVDEGLAWDAALTLALSYTIAPFCCPRLSDGSLEAAAADVLLDAWQTLLDGGPGALATSHGGRP